MKERAQQRQGPLVVLTLRLGSAPQSPGNSQVYLTGYKRTACPPPLPFRLLGLALPTCLLPRLPIPLPLLSPHVYGLYSSSVFSVSLPFSVSVTLSTPLPVP